jgi:hypothetical protein
MALGSTQPLTEMSTSNVPVGKWQPDRQADLTAVYGPIVYTKGIQSLCPRTLRRNFSSTLYPKVVVYNSSYT